jgi:hypothetical protein
MPDAWKTFLGIVSAFALVISLGIQVQTQETAPPLVRQMYNGNWPSMEEAQ